MTEEIKNSSDSIQKVPSEQSIDFSWLGDQSLDDLRSYKAFEQKSLLSQDTGNCRIQRDKETATWIQGQLALISRVVDKRDLV